MEKSSRNKHISGTPHATPPKNKYKWFYPKWLAKIIKLLMSPLPKNKAQSFKAAKGAESEINIVVNSALGKSNLKAINVAKEIKATELEYKAAIHAVGWTEKKVLKHLENAPEDLSSAEDFYGWIESLNETSKTLLDEFPKTIETSDDIMRVLGSLNKADLDVFLGIQVYTPFSDLAKEYHITFTGFLPGKDKKLAGISNLIAAPMQRMTRYNILLENLLKAVKASEFANKKVLESGIAVLQEKIQDILQQMQEQMPENPSGK